VQITAAVAHQNGGPLVLESLELDEPRPDELLVRIVATGLCHTDLVMLDQMPLTWPTVFGHEGVGVVEKVGTAVSGFAVGDHVVLTGGSCGTCQNCLTGQPSFCSSFAAANMSAGRADGSWTHQQDGKPAFGQFFGQSSFATYALTSERNSVRIDSHLPLALMAPFGCGVLTGAGAVFNTLRVREGTSLAVFGAGAVGLSALMAARIAGCRTIVAVDVKPDRLRLAAELGADRVINAAETDVVEALSTIGGVDYAVEAAGNSVVMGQAIASLGPNGEAVLVGVALGQTVSFDPTVLQSRGLTVKGTLLAGRDGVPQELIPRLIEHWKAGQLPIERLVAHYDFADIATAVADARTGSAIKPVLHMQPRADGTS
jgi:aryl-alcohol dehydrogenase